jgi:hypothetical protein
MDSFNKESTKAAPAQADIKPLSERHAVYYDMLQMLELSAEHWQQLIGRGLNDDIIAHNMYKTMPIPYSKQYSALMYQLSKTHDLSGVPGFYLRNGQWHMITKKGLLIPVCDQYGYIQGLQIRLNDESKRKYRWFSSNHYDHGTRIQPWIHVAKWTGSSTVYVTEGALKAEVAAFFMGDVCIVGLAGVHCINGFSELLKELGMQEVIEAFDMDKLTNPYVADALQSLKKIVIRQGIKYRSATWHPSYKGIDDFQFALWRRSNEAA